MRSAECGSEGERGRIGEGCLEEHHLSVARTARYFTLGSPRGVAEVWFACHGYGQLAGRFLEKLRALDDGRRYLVAPEGLSRFYLSDSPAERVTALGFSQGAATVSRWAGMGRSPIDHVVLWGGELPPDLDLAAARERLSRVRFTLVYGVADEFITQTVIDGIVARLREHGIAHSVRQFEGGHELNEDVLREVAR